MKGIFLIICCYNSTNDKYSNKPNNCIPRPHLFIQTIFNLEIEPTCSDAKKYIFSIFLFNSKTLSL